MKDKYGHKKHFLGGMIIQLIIALIFILKYGIITGDKLFGILILGAGSVFILQVVIKEWVIDKIIRHKNPSFTDNKYTFYGLITMDILIIFIFIILR